MGGDGTVGACAAGLADFGPGASAALAVVPAGGGNAPPRSLGRPARDPLAAAGRLTRLHRRPADLAMVAGRGDLSVAGAGFASEANRVPNQRLGWAGNRPRYVGAVLAQLAVGRTARFRLVLDGRAQEVAGWLVRVVHGARV